MQDYPRRCVKNSQRAPPEPWREARTGGLPMREDRIDDQRPAGPEESTRRLSWTDLAVAAVLGLLLLVAVALYIIKTRTTMLPLYHLP